MDYYFLAVDKNEYIIEDEEGEVVVLAVCGGVAIGGGGSATTAIDRYIINYIFLYSIVYK